MVSKGLFHWFCVDSIGNVYAGFKTSNWAKENVTFSTFVYLLPVPKYNQINRSLNSWV